MKIIYALIFLSILSCGKLKNEKKIDAVCGKSFLYSQQDVFKYYFTIKIFNSTSTKLNLGIEKISIDGNDFLFKYGDKILYNPMIKSDDRENYWQVNPKDSVKLMYFIESNKFISKEYIQIFKDDKIIDSIKIPKYIKLKEPMNIEQVIYETDGIINKVG